MASLLCSDFELRLLPPFEQLAAPVACHADMLMFRHGRTLVLHRDYYNANRALFEGADCEIVLCDERVGAEYPDDILLNALPLGNTLFANQKHISPKIASLFDRAVNVKQGYAACSCCKVTESAIITADKGIARAVSSVGGEALLISPGHILLEGYGHGFIGGACFTHGDKVFFFGDLASHPDSERIGDFIRSHGKRAVSLTDAPLTDLGGAVVISR